MGCSTRGRVQTDFDGMNPDSESGQARMNRSEAAKMWKYYDTRDPFLVLSLNYTSFRGDLMWRGQDLFFLHFQHQTWLIQKRAV